MDQGDVQGENKLQHDRVLLDVQSQEGGGDPSCFDFHEHPAWENFPRSHEEYMAGSGRHVVLAQLR
eukprot:1693499-Alexandrium_andersonii.AAC.1